MFKCILPGGCDDPRDCTGRCVEENRQDTRATFLRLGRSLDVPPGGCLRPEGCNDIRCGKRTGCIAKQAQEAEQGYPEPRDAAYSQEPRVLHADLSREEAERRVDESRVPPERSIPRRSPAAATAVEEARNATPNAKTAHEFARRTTSPFPPELLPPGPNFEPGDDMDLRKTPKADGGGLRFNAGKNQLELIPVEWIWGLGMVLTRGAAKYAVRNWEKGMKWSYPVGCALRHILKFVCGERYDPETGCHHLFMAAWNCCALATYDIRRIGENDLVGALDWIKYVAIAPGPELQAIIDRKTGETDAARKAAT